MTLAEIIKDRNADALREWARREAAAAVESAEDAYHDVQDATDHHGPAMQVTLAADRGECSRDDRGWALRIVGEAFDDQPLQEVDA